MFFFTTFLRNRYKYTRSVFLHGARRNVRQRARERAVVLLKCVESTIASAIAVVSQLHLLLLLLLAVVVLIVALKFDTNQFNLYFQYTHSLAHTLILIQCL